MENLTNILNYYLRACRNAQDTKTSKTFFDQAFGAVQYHLFVFPYTEKEVESLWNEYKAQFEYIIYGWEI